MVSPNTLDTKIIDTQRNGMFVKANLDRDVGIELELEGSLSPIEAIFAAPEYWTSKSDGSLRNGLEFVLSKPIKLSQLDAACSELEKALAFMAPKTSIRTSTHVHVNVLDLTVKQVYQAAAGYYLVEELLFSTQPKERRGNLFCLRMSDADSVSIFLAKSLRTGRFFRLFNNEDHYKYSALNLCTVTRFGSLEFRIFQAMMPKEFKKWVKACHALIRNSAKYEIKALLDLYDLMPVKDFLKTLMPGCDFIWGDKSDEFLNECLHTNYDSLRDLSRLVGQPTFITPKEFWLDDTEPPDMNSVRYRHENGIETVSNTYDFDSDETYYEPPTEFYDEVMLQEEED